jgi:hypothetical protein
MPTDLKPGRNKICQNLPAVGYRAKPLGILRFDDCNMPMVIPTNVRMATVSKISRIWRTSFYINGCVTLWTVALRRQIFKQKKGFATISLGLKYCSMGSTQSPSCDTVPLAAY